MTKFLGSRNMVLLHFTVLIWGFTGVLGDLISVSALPLVWYRVVIASIALWLFFTVKGVNYRYPWRQVLSFVGVGAIVGLHWVLFFHAIKISTISVTLVSLSSVTLFTAILEPIINRKKISYSDIFVGTVIIFGIYLIFAFEFQYFWGIISGLSAALCASLFSILNGRMVRSADPKVITFYEMIGAFIGVSLMLALSGGFDSSLFLTTSDLVYLLLLGVVCTAFAYVIGVAVMKELSAFSVALATNMEPIYGVVLALLIFGQREAMSAGFYFGAVIILGAVFLYPTLKGRWESKRTPTVV